MRSSVRCRPGWSPLAPAPREQAAQARSRTQFALVASSRWSPLPAYLALAVLVFEHERPVLLDCLADIRRLHQAFERKLLRAHLVLHVPSLHVEHAVGVDRPVGVARRPGIVMQELRTVLGPALDEKIDHGGAILATVIGVAIIA